MRKMALLLACLAWSARSAAAAEYAIDPEHSSVLFRVRHLVGRVTGQFDKFSGTFTYEKENPKAWKTAATIDAASINTKTPERDKHLRSADFFEVEKYPTLSFTSTRVDAVKGARAKLLGKLTIHGVTKSVALSLEIGGAAKDPYGNERAAFVATGRINRKDFGLTWNDVLETGGALVGDDVDLTLEIEGIKKK